MEMIDLRDKDFINQLITEINGSERTERQRDHMSAYQVFRGALKAKVQDELKRTRPESWNKYTISDISISNIVIGKKAQAYKEQPIRTIYNDDGTVNKEKTDSYHFVLREMSAHRHFKEFDEIFNLQYEALLWPRYDMANKKWYLSALAPYEYSLVKNKDTGEVEVVILHYPNTRRIDATSQGDAKSDIIAESQDDAQAEGEVYALWSKDQHVVVEVSKKEFKDKSGKTMVKIDIDFVPLEDNPNNVNPLGRLPFAYLSNDNSADLPYINPITQQTISWNALWSELLTAANIQGTGQFVLSYPEDMEGNFDKMKQGLFFAVALPQKNAPGAPRTEATYISPSPNLEAQKAVYLEQLRKMLQQQGIYSSQGVAGDAESFSSALERMVANADVQGIIESNQGLYKMVEDECFAIIQAWDKLLDSEPGYERMFLDEDEITVKYQKPKILISDTEVLANIEKQLSLGLIEKWEALKMLDPNLTDEQAQEKISKIESKNMTSMMRLFNGGQGNEDADSGPEQGSKESVE